MAFCFLYIIFDNNINCLVNYVDNNILCLFMWSSCKNVFMKYYLGKEAKHSHFLFLNPFYIQTSFQSSSADAIISKMASCLIYKDPVSLFMFMKNRKYFQAKVKLG